MTDLQYLSELKKELLRKFCEAHPYHTGELKDFGVREIALFQNMLLEKTGGRVSEKWFYTHLKKDRDKLPRIDVLDLLSEFVGHENWASFKGDVERKWARGRVVKKKRKTGLILSLALAVFVLIIFVSYFFPLKFNPTKKYEVCFVDAMTQKPLGGVEVKIEQRMENESPKIYRANEEGCYVFGSENEKLTFIVQANYFRTDTITRILREKNQLEIIPLVRDDYAWMIHLFSKGKLGNWEKRRNQLGEMIAEDAMIFQINEGSGQAMELLNKSEFITKLTLPLGSLGELEIIQTEYNADGHIRMIRFYQKRGR